MPVIILNSSLTKIKYRKEKRAMNAISEKLGQVIHILFISHGLF